MLGAYTIECYPVEERKVVAQNGKSDYTILGSAKRSDLCANQNFTASSTALLGRAADPTHSDARTTNGPTRPKLLPWHTWLSTPMTVADGGPNKGARGPWPRRIRERY